ncbi:immunity 49 family protein [Streptomyces sp. NPDC093589]|uniref:immunity 49 family protein n=1 Tax=Streptomyces sp. NPDC093589 TaxID=3366043 RepID=UPI003802E7BF
MVKVSRHDYPSTNLEKAVELFTKDVERKISTLPRSAERFSGTLGSALRIFNIRCAEDQQAERLETWESLVTAMQVSSALFTSARATTDTFDALIGHKKLTLKGGALPWAHAGNWLTAFWLACVCREKRRLNELCEVPVSLLRQSGAVFDEYIYDWVEALQAYWLNRPELGDKLVAAVDGTDPDALRYADASGVLRIAYPPMNLLTQLARGDQQKFNAELVNALEWHKGYWTRDEERELEPEGVTALGPMAVTCLAIEAGFDIDVESEYLPACLLARDWVGEFPTS